MTLLIAGSIATDHLMSFPGKFADRLVVDQLDKLSVSFLDSPGAWVFAEAAPIAHWQGEEREQPELAVCGPCHALRRVIADRGSAIPAHSRIGFDPGHDSTKFHMSKSGLVVLPHVPPPATGLLRRAS